ncbi:STAS domain-containing protein [Catellatospora methionotrophica]|uniref:STAS domain-containing protein n=1 Tax=Catellatospora methionotrophica TaxID=121620 RepID=UPI0033D6E5B5
MRSAPATHCYRAGRSNRRHGTSRPISATPARRTTLNTSTFRRQAEILSIRLRTLAGSPHLVVTGEVEASNVYLLSKVADAVMRTRAATELTLDMSAVTFIDGTGVAAVHACRRQAATRGLRFLIINLSAAVAAALTTHGDRRALTRPPRLPSPATAPTPGRSRPRGRGHRSRCAQRRPAGPA